MSNVISQSQLYFMGFLCLLGVGYVLDNIEHYKAVLPRQKLEYWLIVVLLSAKSDSDTDFAKYNLSSLLQIWGSCYK